MSNGMDERPASVLGKRQRPWNIAQAKNAREIISRNIELEISLRERALEAAEAKIQWAETMRQVVVDGVQGRPAADLQQLVAFRTESAETLRAIERLQPLRHNLATLSPPRTRAMNPAEGVNGPDVNHSSGDDTLSPLPLAIDPIAEDTDNAPADSSKPLFIQQESLSGAPPTTVLIACEVCSRSDFPTIHSLLSHGRMSHGIYYRGHEELIGRCGRVVTGSEAARIRRFGTEASSRILLGVRTVIQQGIGEAEGGDPSVLARTLGLHADSTALASFLGKKPKMHSIRVYEPEGEIDIESVDDVPTLRKPVYRRSRVIPDRTRTSDRVEDEIDTLAPHIRVPDPFEVLKPAETSSDAEVFPSASRYHVKRRIVITDSSHWMSPDERPASGRTHQWMITVSAPSYSEHVTTFVAKLAVSPADKHTQTASPEECLRSTDHPPFSVIGFASEPFLARIQLGWVGGPSKPLIVSHWVRLDSSKATRSALGENQTLDVELDRATPFRDRIKTLPMRWMTAAAIRATDNLKDVAASPVASAVHKVDAGISDAIEAEEALRAKELEYLVPTLRRLLVKVPLTSQDLRARAVDGKTVDYKLPRSLNDMMELDYGRRKAYEWRHAASLKGVLLRHAETDATLSKRLKDIRNITTGMIYRWMDASDVFVRPAIAVEEDSIDNLVTEGVFCRFCGLPLDAHPEEEILQHVVKLEDRIPDVEYDPPARRPLLCPESYRLPSIIRRPVLDVQPWLTSVLSAPATFRQDPPHVPMGDDITSRDIVRSTDPQVIQYIQDLTGSFCLPRFDASTLRLGDLSFGPGRREAPVSETDDAIAPYALLGQCLRLVVRDLVTGGVESARWIAEQVKGQRHSEDTARASAIGEPLPAQTTSTSKQILTASHILQGLSRPSGRVAHLRACIGQLAVGPPGIVLPAVPGSFHPVSNPGEKGIVVKREELE